MYSVVKPALLSLLLTSTALPLIAEEPALPPGLGGSSETAPALPPGLAPEQNATPEPALPSGLFEDSTDDSIADDDSDLSDIYSLGGFAEIRAGAFVNDNPHQNKASIGEARLHLVLDAAYEAVDMRIAVDFLADPVEGNADIDLESGTGPLDLREAWLLMRPTDFADLKLGRQILTWGTGDLVFINDMFPKDFQSFFTGRDDEYLKAPSDAAKLSLFHDMANLDIVYTPRFDADRHLTGRRVNFFNPLANDVTGRNRESITNRPEDWFIDDEWALRLYGDVAATEWAIYAYSGYFKSPNASNKNACAPSKQDKKAFLSATFPSRNR